MKKSGFIIVAFIVILNALPKSVSASAISQADAAKVALTYYKYNAKSPAQNAYVKSLAYVKADADGTIDYYIFDIYPKGFVIVSADNNVEPVIGFSDESYFYEIKNIGIDDWMEKKAIQIHHVITNNVAAMPTVTTHWQAYLQGQNIITARTASVGPLLQTTWNQSPYYNEYCPGGSVTGCVATAMAQIMKYWNYPVRGTGSYSYSDPPYGTLSANFDTAYSWTIMPDSVVTTGAGADAAAFLAYQAGVSVAMEYSPTESGAYVLESDVPSGYPCAQLSYISYFGYNPNIQGIYQASFSTEQWDSILNVELNDNRVVQYAGYGSDGGHTWVLDGCNSSGLFHMNWGWGGLDNGLFDLDNLNPGGVPLGSGDEALIYIIPPIDLPKCSDKPSAGVISSNSDTICSGGGAILNLTGYTNSGVGIHITWQQSANGTTNWKTAQAASADSGNTYVTPALTVSTFYRSIVSCRASGLSDTSAVIKVIVPGILSTAVSEDTLCTPKNITLTANAVGAPVNWYSSSTSAKTITTGPTLNAYVSSDTTFYVSTGKTAPYTTGIADSGSGSYFNYTYDDGLLFNALGDFTLDSLYVYASSTGTVEVYLVNTNSEIAIDSVPVTINSNQVNSPVVVHTNFTCTAGTGYNITATGSTVNALYRTSSGANYPYTVNDILTITGPNNGAAGHYYFFYNWHITSGCMSPRVPVVITYSAPQIKATASANSITVGDSTLLTATGGFASYLWTPGNLTGASVYVDPTVPTVYTVTGTTGDGCTNSASVSIDVTTGVNIVNASNSSIQVYPNPTTGQFELTMNNLPANTYDISVYDMLGHKLSDLQIVVNSSTYTLPMDASEFPAGMYLVRVTNYSAGWLQPIVKR